ncbi:MAG: MaoC/PaaZ C-terminal domain-containing protein [Myxococcota bacterium]
MALNLDAVGKTTKPLEFTYNWKDAVLYALGIGAKKAELDFLFEGRGPKVFPTFAVLPTFPVCAELFMITGGNLLGVVHGSQSITLHRPFASSGKLTTVGTVQGIYDLKRMAQAVFTTETRDESGELLCESEWGILFRMDGGFNGPRPPKTEKHRVPERDPDFEVEETTAPEQALLYRLCGDLNPLHADPEIGEKAGFGQPILHGLATYGFAGRAVLHACCDGDPSRLKRLSGQFRRPVWPGDTLVTRGWNEDGRVLLQTRTKERPEEMAFTNAFAVVE